MAFTDLSIHFSESCYSCTCRAVGHNTCLKDSLFRIAIGSCKVVKLQSSIVYIFIYGNKNNKDALL